MRLFLIAVLLPFVGGCSDACTNTVVTSAIAPDGRHSAALFQRDCGATTGFSTQISLVSPGKEPAGAGDAFRADDDHGAATVGTWGGPWAEVKWLAADHLLVKYAAKSRVFRRAEQIDGVRLTYEAVPR